MRTKAMLCGLVLLACVLAPAARAQGGAIDTALAAQYFREARAACERDGGRLWGINPCGPLLFVDGPTLLVVLTDRRRVTNNTNTAVPLEGVGTVYQISNVTDDWGALDVTGGALMIQSPGGRITHIYLTALILPSSERIKLSRDQLNALADFTSRMVP